MKYFAPFTMVVFLGSLVVGGQALAGGPEHPDKVMGMGEPQQVTLEQLDSEKARKLQQALQEQGFNPGAIDGEISSETREAIREFQQDEGIPATGQLDRQTVEALDLDAQEFLGVAPPFDQQQHMEMDRDRETDFQRNGQRMQQPERNGLLGR